MSKIEAYLTIDDSPTPFTDYILDALAERSVPALFFIRGDMIEKYGDAPLRKAIRMGFTLGNHMATHTRTSTMNFEDVKREIKFMHDKIDKLYKEEGFKASPKYFRFPHMDRGTGGHIIDYSLVPDQHRDFVISLFTDGLNVTMTPPSRAQIEQKQKTQEYLKELGYSQPFEGINFPWFAWEMATAADCMYTFSTSDWVLLNRHLGKWAYKSMDDLKKKIDSDTSLGDKSSRHIILAHDKDEDGFNQNVIGLVDYFLSKDFKFLPFETI